VISGAKLLDECITDFDSKMHDDRIKELSANMFKIVFTRDSIQHHYDDDAFVKCLMNLPVCFLDRLEFGEECSDKSEFCIRARFVKYNSERLTKDDKRKIMLHCDPKKLDIEGLKFLESMNIMSDDEMVNLYRLALESQDRTNQDEKIVMVEDQKQKKEIDDLQDECKKMKELIQKIADICLETGESDKTAKAILNECYCSGYVTQKVPKKPEESDKQGPVKQVPNSTNVREVLLHSVLEYKGQKKVPQDAKVAFKLFEREAKKGNVRAMLDLAACYANGVGVAKNEKNAMRLCQRAGFNENRKELYILADEILKGKKKRVHIGHAMALNNLATLYMVEGSPEGKKKGFQLFEFGAQMGCTDAMCNLALCYINGESVPKDEKKAVEIYERAASMGSGDAMSGLGLCYMNGIGVPKDEKKAIQLYERASSLGCIDALCKLSRCYELGQGVPKNEITAQMLGERAGMLSVERAKIYEGNDPKIPNAMPALFF